MNTFVNAAPQLDSRGVQDGSTTTPLAVADPQPTHMPWVYIYAAKGPGKPGEVVAQRVSDADRTNLFGIDSFDPRGVYFNHATSLSNILAAEANAHMLARIVPADVGPRANFALYLDVLPVAEMPQYKRNVLTGAIMLDGTGAPQVADAQAVTAFAGYKIKVVVERISALADETKFGTLTAKAGDQTSTVGGVAVQSQRYPILQWVASSYGEAGNNSGIRLSAPISAGASPLDAKAMADTGAYPMRLQVIRRANAKSTPVIVDSLDGDKFIDFALKPGAMYTTYNIPYYLGERFSKKYRNTDKSQGPINYGDFEQVYVYDAVIAQLLTQFYTSESAYIDAATTAGNGLPVTKDFVTGDATQKFLINILTGVNSGNEPYYSLQFDTAGAGAIRLSETTNLYAGGGANGTMSDQAFADAVTADIAHWADPLHRYQDDALYPVSIFYDTGFPLASKRDLFQFMALRKDTVVVGGVHVAGEPAMTTEQERSVATLLRTYAQLYPESDYYGTATMRAFIVGQSGRLVGSSWTQRLPLTLQIAKWCASMMGAANGIWKRDRLFDIAPNNIVDLFTEVNNTSVPVATRAKNWALGMNWAQSFSETQVFFPAIKSVYDNDTSVLNSLFVVMGAVELQKVGQRVWREFTGAVRYTEAVLCDRVNQSVLAKTQGRFADLFKITPAAYISEGDALLGYKWTLPITLEANNMKTVMTLDVKAMRMTA